MRERSIYREKLSKVLVVCEKFPILWSREKSGERNSSAREDLRSSGSGCLKAQQYVRPKSVTSTKRLFLKKAIHLTHSYQSYWLSQKRLDSSSQRIMGRVIKELSYTETVELDGISVIHVFFPILATIVLELNIFAQKVYPMKYVINFSRLSG